MKTTTTKSRLATRNRRARHSLRTTKDDGWADAPPAIHRVVAEKNQNLSATTVTLICWQPRERYYCFTKEEHHYKTVSKPRKKERERPLIFVRANPTNQNKTAKNGPFSNGIVMRFLVGRIYRHTCLGKPQEANDQTLQQRKQGRQRHHHHGDLCVKLV